MDLKKIVKQIDSLQTPSPEELRFAYRELCKAREIVQQLGPRYSLASAGLSHDINCIQEVMFMMKQPLVVDGV